MKLLAPFAKYARAIAFLFVIGTGTALSFLWPASYWLEVRSIHIADGPESDKLPMIVDRTVKRSFVGTWTVVIRRWEGEWTIACTAVGGGDYSPTNKYPKNLTLGWWTIKQCHPLIPGRYSATTVWRIEIPGLPDREVRMTSNVFTVTEN